MLYTYLEKRKCVHCGKPLPDQYSLGRTHCKPILLANGKWSSCKDKKWSAIRKVDEVEFRNIKNFQKNMYQRIESLYRQVGEIVSVQQIDKFGINLMRCVELAVSKDGQNWEYRFVTYGFQKININTFKIIQHGKTF